MMATREAAPSGALAPTRVLVIDDHRMFADLVAGVLHELDDVVVTGIVGSGPEGLAAVAASRPDVVLLDYRLPGEDGVATAARIRREAPDTKILMLTGHDDDALLSAALAAGCSGFITKDRAMTELVAAVRAVRSGARPTDTASVARPTGRPTLETSALTARELEVLRLLAEGVSTREIADGLFISLNTSRNYVQRLIAKLGAHSRLEAVAVARRAGLLQGAGPLR